MSPLSQELDRYLRIRRSLGYTLSTHERILRKFVAFADTENSAHVSSALFLRWKGVFGKANNIALPKLPPQRAYAYDEKEHKLIILEYEGSI